MYSKASLHQPGLSAEDSLKIASAFPMSRAHYDQSLYVESARRVVFRNCMEKCELDDESLPNFNRKFYYVMDEARACLQSCYNARMQAHFGPMAQQVDGLQYDFDQLKNEYKSYERWHPKNAIVDQYARGFDEDNVKSTIQRLKEKTAKEAGRFDFQ